MVAAHIAKHGVTRCPTAALEPTTGEISIEDRERHRVRGLDPVGDVWRGMNSKARYRMIMHTAWAKKQAAKAGM
jgi:hypothetical protein